MHITINGNLYDAPERPTIAALLVHLSLVEGPVAVEINRQIVPRAQHETHVVAENDVLEIVHLVGGG